MDTINSLTVYKASAGSGKTFMLATEYIKMLIQDPQNYKGILAVTFTNKATEEMKMRILSQLYGIWKQLPDSKVYIEKITDELCLSKDVVSLRSREALTNIIHNYNMFNVETIDTFFQKVLRNLARELELNANLHVELNDIQIEQQAVDELIDGLSSKDLLLQWIMDYIRENINDDKGWNVIGKIKSFGENIFKDVYKQNSNVLNEKIKEKDFFTRFNKFLLEIKRTTEEELIDIGNVFFKILEDKHLCVSDFANKNTGVCGYFIKLQSGITDEEKLLGNRVLDAIDNPQNWVKKSDIDNNSLAWQAVNNVLWQYLIVSENKRKMMMKSYKSSILTSKHLYQLRILNSIETKVRELNNNSNRFLLSDTQSLLNELIKETDSPFIFEKIGTKLNHIMIDEFQDTSNIQWKNFKTLLLECMSHRDSNNLIVGDVKQSIYRWRSGDWRLLNNIENEFNKEQINTKKLDTNYRSESNIIEFNNSFFTTAISFEIGNQISIDQPNIDELEKAYSDVIQNIPNGKTNNGFVNIELLPNHEYDEAVMKKTASTIQMLIENGVKTNDIAILIRTNDKIQDMADYLMETIPSVNILSSEAFRLDSSVAVNMIIDALSVIVSDDALTKANLAKAYQKLIIGNVVDDNQMLIKTISINDLLPSEFMNHIDELGALPLSDLVERICGIFGINKLNDQNAYLCEFYDQLDKFLIDNGTDVKSFLEEWEKSIYKKTIQSDGAEGIRLLTIHKSKGLEFDNVIIPFCDWKLENSNTTIWCKPEEEPFNELPLVPIDYSKKHMIGSIFENDYKHESLQNTVDNMNLLYVAFTRASKNLFVFTKRNNKSDTRSVIIQQCVEKLADEMPGVFVSDDNETLTFKYGDLYVNKKNSDISLNVFKPSIENDTINIEVYNNNLEFKQSNKSRDFIEGTDEEEKQKSYIEMGNILHNILSNIKTTEDVETVLSQFERDGILYDSIITKSKIREMLIKRLSDSRISDWFSPRWTVFNECTVLSIDPNTNKLMTLRPDRVISNGNEMIVIDFKFGKPNHDYNIQVGRYMSLLKSMGYDNVKGFLWFVYSNIIEEIK